MELDNNKNEVLAKRTVVTLSVSEAEIRKRPRERDDHVHCHRKGGKYSALQNLKLFFASKCDHV